MATRIFDLPIYNFDMVVGRNEDWRDSWPYRDAAGNPISLAGIALDFTLEFLSTGALAVVASTGTSVGGLPLNGRVASGGANDEVFGLNVPRTTMLRLAAGRYAHEGQGRADGITRTIARGFVTVLQGQAP